MKKLANNIYLAANHSKFNLTNLPILGYKIRSEKIYDIQIQTCKNLFINIDFPYEDYSNTLKDYTLWENLSILAVSIAKREQLDALRIPIPFSIWMDFDVLIDHISIKISSYLRSQQIEDLKIYIEAPYDYHTEHQIQMVSRRHKNELFDIFSFSSGYKTTIQSVVDDVLDRTGNMKDRFAIIDPDIYTKMGKIGYTPSKETVVSIVIGCGLSIEEANEFLNQIGYHLSPYIEYDQIILEAIERDLDIDETNQLLLKRTKSNPKGTDPKNRYIYHAKLLGTRRDKNCSILEKLGNSISEDEYQKINSKWACF
jgi:hypothetical protein